jgi:DNA processing protein
MDEERKYFLLFSVFPGIGPVRFKLLYDYFGSAKAAATASESALHEIKLGDKLTREFIDFRKTFNLDNYLHELVREHIGFITINDPNYPKLLKNISDPPFVLYVKGKKTDPPIGLTRTIGVVGTRKITPYGIEVTERLVQGLVEYGFTIVSGMAYGVDAVAHKTTIAAGGKTIAVLGCGADVIAPPTNAGIYKQITQDGFGAVISEMPLGLRPNKGLFPARNRIISGLSLGVLVTEGATDSGSLITARNAGEQGREVFAVPGPITSEYSAGPAKLLKNGAKLVETVEDIIEELGLTQKIGKISRRKIVNLGSENEKKIMEILTNSRMQIDEIVRESGLTISDVASTLTILEINGLVKDYGEKTYGIT